MKRLNLYAGLGVILWGMLSGATTVATAAPVTFYFTGVISAHHESILPGLNLGAGLSGFYTFNDATPDSDGTLAAGQYNNAITALTANLGDHRVTLGIESPGRESFIMVLNQPVPGVDAYVVGAPLSAAVMDAFNPLYFRITLTDPSATVFASASLPTTPPSLSGFAAHQRRFVVEDGSGVVRLSGSLTSFRVLATPVPAAVMLFGAGLIALVGLGAGGLRNLRRPQA